MTLVIIIAGIDLSVGAMLGLNSVLTAMLMTAANLGLVPTLLLVLIAGTTLELCKV
jgi:ribose transport system permease protein